jgi:hypothetical protein
MIFFVQIPEYYELELRLMVTGVLLGCRSIMVPVGSSTLRIYLVGHVPSHSMF